MRNVRMLFLVLFLNLAAASLFSQIIVTPTLISAQSGTSLYCAAKYANPQVQVYCYTTIVKSWDKLIYNQIFSTDQNNAIVANYNQNYNQVANKNYVTFLFFRGSDGILNWQILINSLPIRSGTF